MESTNFNVLASLESQDFSTASKIFARYEVRRRGGGRGGGRREENPTALTVFRSFLELRDAQNELAISYGCAIGEAFDKLATSDEQNVTFSALNALSIVRKRIPLPGDTTADAPCYTFQVGR
jgi:hypothetical protein